MKTPTLAMVTIRDNEKIIPPPPGRNTEIPMEMLSNKNNMSENLSILGINYSWNFKFAQSE